MNNLYIFQNHANVCKKVVNVLSEETSPGLPTTQLPTPHGSDHMLSLTTMVPGVPTHMGTLSPSPSPPPFPSSPFLYPASTVRFDLPGLSVSTPSTSTLPSTSVSPGFGLGPTILPAPLVPPIALLPMTGQHVVLPLREALGVLSRTCPLCWLRGLDNEHNLFGCPNARPKKFATSGDALFQVFKMLIRSPPGRSLCYGCFLPTDVSVDAPSYPFLCLLISPLVFVRAWKRSERAIPWEGVGAQGLPVHGRAPPSSLLCLY